VNNGVMKIFLKDLFWML